MELWLHIGLHYLNPFAPTFHEARPLYGYSELAPDKNRVYVESVGRFADPYKPMFAFAKCSTISARWYRLEETERPIARFVPSPLPIVLVPQWAEAERFWPRRKPGARGGKGGDVGGDEDLVDEDGPAVGAEDPESSVGREALDVLDTLLDAFDAPVDAVAGGFEERPGGPSSSSSGDPLVADAPLDPGDPPPLPPPPSPPLGHVRERRGGVLTARLANGTLTYYASNQSFEATCNAHRGERCTLTSKATAATPRQAALGRGRPLGFLALWLEAAPVCFDKDDHKHPDQLRRLASEEAFEERRLLRDGFHAIEGMDALAAAERQELAPGEGVEPRSVPHARAPGGAAGVV